MINKDIIVICGCLISTSFLYAPYQLTIVFGEVQVRTISLCIEQNVIVKVSCVSLLLHAYSNFFK